MPPKAATAVTIIETLGENTIILERSDPSQLVTIIRLNKTIKQINLANKTLKNKINNIGRTIIKMLLVKRFIGERSRLKGFLTQIKLKIRYKKAHFIALSDKVIYIGLFLIG